MRKRLLSLFCALSLLLTLLPTSAFAVENGAEGTTAQTKDTEVAETATEKTELVSLTADELDDPYEGLSGDDLLMGYLYSISGLNEASPFRAPTKPLTGLLKDVETDLKNRIAQVAEGNLASTKFEFKDVKWSMTPEKWGISGDVFKEVDTADGKKPRLTDEAKAAVEKKLDSNELLHKLLSDMPYELYWFDKTVGMETVYSYMTSLVEGELVVSTPVISMTVSVDYAQKEGESYRVYETDTNKTKAVAGTPEKAKAVVDMHNGKSDYEKLVAYSDYIKDRVSYDDDAAKWVPNGQVYYTNSPWQLINVFAPDEASGKNKVVCEGYAKAFQYLCDLTTFADNGIQCALVTGNMTGSDGKTGPHMWNVVHMDDDKNYLVDVTNCDENTIGAPDQLFLCGATATTEGKVYTATTNSNNIVYTYGEDTLNNYEGMNILNLATENYKRPAALTGSVTITGEAKIGQTLTADTTGLTSTDSTALGTLTYQWYRVKGSEVTRIVDADGETYTPNDAADVDSKIKVVVFALNCTGNKEDITENTVAKADSTIFINATTAPKTVEYTGNAVAYPAQSDVTKTGSNGEVTFTYYTNAACKEDNTTTLADHGATAPGGAPKNAGEYWVKATVAADETHDGETSDAAAFKITPKGIDGLSVDVTEAQTTVKGDGSFVQPTLKGLNDEKVNYTLTYSIAADTDSGVAVVTNGTYADAKASLANAKADKTITVSYTFTATATDGTNYTGTKTGSITVTVKDIAFTVNNAPASADNAVTVKPAPTYGDTWAEIVTVKSSDITAKVGDQNVEGTYTVVSSDDDAAVRPKAGDNKSYTVKFTSADNAYKDVTVFTGSITVTAKPVTIAGLSVADKEYDGTTTATVTGAAIDGKVDSDKLTLKTGSATFDNANAGTGKTVTIIGYELEGEDKDNYTLTQPTGITGNITPAPLTIESVTVAAKTYDGTKTATVQSVNFTGMKKSETLDKNDYTVTGEFDTADAGENKNVTVTVTLKDTDTAKNYTLENGGIFKKENAKIDKADQDKPTLTISSAQAFVGDKSVPTLTADGGKTGSYTYTSSDTDVAMVDETTGKLTIKAAGTTELKVMSKGNGNYKDSTESDAVQLKVLSSMTLTVMDTKAKTEELKAHLKNQGAITVGEPKREDGTNNFIVEVKGNRPLIAYESSDSSQTGLHKWIGLLIGQFTVNGGAAAKLDTLEYAIGTADNWHNLTEQDVNDANPVGGDGTQLVLWIKTDVDNSRVIFLKDSSGNVAQLTINFTEYTTTPVTPSQPGGGSTSGSGTVKTDTVTNPDGSVTKTETKRDGTVIETTTGKDGSVSKTTTNPNGSSVTETKAADGSTGTVKTDERGQTKAETTLSSKAIETAKRNGEPVKAPVEVKATRDSSTAPTVKIELPRNSGDTKVEIPVTNVKPGTVAVIVHPDGTEEIVKNSLPTEDGIQLTVNGGATVKIVDNSRDFIDTQNHWAKDAIDFVSARELVNGMNDSIYAPNNSTTRAQLWTILARQNDADLSGGTNWYEKAQLWAKDKGVSDGANPNGTINRAQMVTMLWRTMGQPTAGGTANFTDVPADSYYASAVAWAVENGITDGVGDGRFDPAATCTRAQIATFLRRAVAE